MPESGQHDFEREERALPSNLRRDQPLVPIDNVAGRALMAVIAILTFLAALSAGAAVLAARASEQWRGAVSNEMTIQIRPDTRRDIEADIARAVAMARAVEGVAAVEPIPRSESDKLLEPWLGTGLDLVELPVPRLIVLKLRSGASPELASFGAALKREVPTAILDDHRLWLRRLSTMASTIILSGAVVVLLVMAAAALAVAFATRGAMAGSRDSVEVLHLVGADDDFIAREFQSRFVRLGLARRGDRWRRRHPGDRPSRHPRLALEQRARGRTAAGDVRRLRDRLGRLCRRGPGRGRGRCDFRPGFAGDRPAPSARAGAGSGVMAFRQPLPRSRAAAVMPDWRARLSSRWL